MRLNIIKSIFFILLFFCNLNTVYSQAVDKRTVLAVLSLNIARFTTWPEDLIQSKSSDLVLCVIGDNIVQESFSSVNQQAVKDQKIRVINVTRLRNFSQCQLLYVSQLDQNILIQVLLEIKQQAILTLGEDIGFLRAGGMVALVDRDGKIELNMNLSKIKQSGLVLSSRLLKLVKLHGRTSHIKQQNK